MTLLAAARLSDPIEHSSALAGLITGLLVGAALGILIVGTGGLAACAVVGAMAAAGAGIGEVVGTMSFAMVTAGSIATGSDNVLVNDLPAARAHIDVILCDQHPNPPPVLAQGSATVFINEMHAARKTELAACSGKILEGSPNVFIGGETFTTDIISPEVPEWLHKAVFVLGFGSAVILVGPFVALAGLGLGMLGGHIGNVVGGAIFGEGSDGQKLFMLGGAFIGGWVGTKGGMWGMGRAIPSPTTPTAAFLRNGMISARTLQYTPTSGVKLVGTPGRTTTIVGNFRQDMTHIVNEVGNAKNTNFGARPGDFQVLNVADELANPLTPEQFWNSYNKPWLEQSVARGDKILVATRPDPALLSRVTDTGEVVQTGFGREIQFLNDNGYVYDPVANVMVPPPGR